MKYYSIGEASARLNVPESTLRYYEKKGLLPHLARDEAGRRLFSEDHLTLLGIVIYLKNTHMPISVIKQYVDWVGEGDRTIEQRLDMMKKHKQAVLAEIALMTESLKGIDKKIARYTNRTQHRAQQGNEEC
ncbi:MerR family transcriptional regulator [Paenibacillus glycinis]|uniref:MerR family transcriptional regulator n=1 Tax=Paenibacillus glycinis TaxID=2697035 RepID=A0ABW9XQV9_9BACL|nr:MerR family transcriptional regulator [Paenibacillus glycinis]NBD24779.1 MerR family transcriptional regulator [Paenibacillus glycinis]